MNFIQNFIQRIKLLLSPEQFLCDSCKYNWGNVCVRPERPNARICTDYKKKY